MEVQEFALRGFVAQARFTANLNLLDRRGAVLSHLRDATGATDFEFSPAAPDVRARTASHGTIVSVSVSDIRIQRQERIDMSEDPPRVADWMTALLSLLENNTILSLGIRTFWLAPGSSFDAAVKWVMPRMREPGAAIFKSLAARPTDVGFNFVFEDVSPQLRLSLGPVNPEQLMTMSIFPRELADDLPEAAVLIDLDRIDKREQTIARGATEPILRAIEKNFEHAGRVIEALNGGLPATGDVP